MWSIVVNAIGDCIDQVPLYIRTVMVYVKMYWVDVWYKNVDVTLSSRKGVHFHYSEIYLIINWHIFKKEP